MTASKWAFLLWRHCSVWLWYHLSNAHPGPEDPDYKFTMCADTGPIPGMAYKNFTVNPGSRIPFLTFVAVPCAVMYLPFLINGKFKVKKKPP